MYGQQSMMGMGYIDVNTVKKKLSIHVAGEFWVFLVLTVILLIFTLGTYFLYIWRNRSDERDDNEAKGT
jgi:uncharacterized membrane protein